MKKKPAIAEILLTGFQDLVSGFQVDARTSPGVLVALSGGPDSVALLRLARLWAEAGGGFVEAAHFNHRLRAADSDQDQQFCADLCRRLSIPLHISAGDPLALAAVEGRGLEDAARRLRLEFFNGLLDADPRLVCCAAGHHRDDQTETLLMRLMRGTGLAGLGGIRPISGRFIHPLLGVDRQALRDWLDDLQQDCRIDATNLGDANTRARVRNELLPLARDIFGAGCERSLLRLGALADQENAYLERIAAAAAETCRSGNTTGLSIDGLLALDPVIAARVLRHHLQGLADFDGDLEETHIRRLLAWLPGSLPAGRCDLTAGWTAQRRGGELAFGPPTDSMENSTVERPAFRLELGAAAAAELRDLSPCPGNLPTPGAVHTLTCPANNVLGRVRLRYWRDGDVIVPFGMTGHRKVADVLREMNVDVAERRNVLIVEDEAGLLWIVDFMRAERTRLLPTTKQGLTIRVHGTQD